MNNVTAGSRLGPYEIVSRIGAGGMGEVWRATDTRLERSVAIKILPAELAQNPQFQVRFEREAKAISQLNHPNICTLHDVGRESGVSYLVMELLDGESLADRLGNGPLPLPDVLRYGAQIADALDRAHRAGIVHRDLKPGNVMLTRAGAKLLDFGLAKSASQTIMSAVDEHTVARNGPGGSSVLHTDNKPLTAEGTIVGTFQYMAPEQLEGRDADPRTDIFALGAVLYEMATGKRAFDGKTKTSLIAAIVGGQPVPIHTLQPLAPPALEHIIARALEKEADDRWQSAHDVAEELRWISEAGSHAGLPVSAARHRRRREGLTIGLAALLAIATIVILALYLGQKKRAERILVADLTAPNATHFNNVGDDAGPPVLSPDGKYVAFSVVEPTATRLCVRTLATGETKVLTGTEGATFPFWSPDSRNLGFFVGGNNLKRVDIKGGAPIVLAPAVAGRGGSWGKDDVIVFAPATLTPLFRVSANGGKAVQVTNIDHSHHTTNRWPSFLPDGKHFLYLAANHQDATGGSNAVFIGSIDGGPARLVMNTTGNAVYSRGHLLFVRDTTLYAQKMSEDGALSGEPSPLLEGVLNDGGIWRGGFSVSDSGDLAYCAGQATLTSHLVWVDRTGKEIGALGGPDMYWDVQISPDQKKLALTIGDPSRQLWLVDLTRNTRTRLDVGARWVGLPAWSPDGTTIIIGAIRDDGFALMAKRLDGAVARVLTVRSAPGLAGLGLGAAVSPDGRTLIYSADRCLWSAPLDQPERARKLTAESTGASDPRFSPDGKWLAYVSGENGRNDVFIALAGDIGQRWQVSDIGGSQPRWRADGGEFYYVDAQNRMTAVEIRSSNGSLDIGAAQKLFTIQLRAVGRAYDVSADGQRFIVNRLPEQTAVSVKLMTNWENALHRR